MNRGADYSGSKQARPGWQTSGLQYIWQGVHFLNAANAAEREESNEASLLR